MDNVAYTVDLKKKNLRNTLYPLLSSKVIIYSLYMPFVNNI